MTDATGSATGSFQVVVADASLSLAGTTPPSYVAGVSLAADLLTFSQANAGQRSAIIRPPLSTGETAPCRPARSRGSGPFTVAGAHNYTVPGSYTLTTLIQDDGGSDLFSSYKVSVAAPTAVPEPATLTLTALGLAGVLSRYRRRRVSR